MEEVVITHSDNSYGIENFSGVTREIIKETESLFNIVYLKETYAETLFLNEAVENSKNILIKAFEKMIEAIKTLSNKFITLANRLVTRNKAWLEKVKSQGDLARKIPDNFSVEIYPYWKGESKLRNYKFPDFQESPEFIEELKDTETFKQKHFKDLYVNIDGKTSFEPKIVFQGGPNKITMNKTLFMQQYQNMVKYIEGYDELAKSINVRNNKIIEFLNNSIRKIRTAVFRESNEFLDVVSTLLEQDGPATSNNIEKQEDGNKNNQDDPNKTDKREEGKNADQLTRNMIKAREEYNRIVYSINSARMGVAEACYNAYVKLVHSAIKDDSKSK